MFMLFSKWNVISQLYGKIQHAQPTPELQALIDQRAFFAHNEPIKYKINSKKTRPDGENFFFFLIE